MKSDLFKSILLTMTLTTNAAAQSVKYEGEYSPTWSPDGNKLAYHKHSSKFSWEVVVKDLATGVITPVTNHQGMDVDPSWSHDGKRLVFSSRRNGNWDIFVYDFATEKVQELVTGPAKQIAPKWSPDGKHLAFIQSVNDIHQLYIQDLTTGKSKQITNSDQPINHPEWSHDGKYLIYDVYFEQDKASRIFQWEVSSSISTMLHQSEGSSIAGKRHGNKLIYTNNRRGNWDIYQKDLASGADILITKSDLNEMKAVISPNFQKLVYSQFDSNGVATLKIIKL